MKLTNIECSGTPREMGRQTGEALREDILANLAVQRPPKPSWMRRLPVMLDTARRYVPDVLDELDGLAEGANVPPEQIYQINFQDWNNELDRDGCTNMVFRAGPDGPVLGKNNDGCHPTPALRSYVRYVKPTKGIPQVVFGAAGRIATTDGMNAEGLAVGHSSVGSVFQQSDHHAFIRLWEYAIRSECATVASFVRRMTELPLHGKGFSIVCVDRAGGAVSLEAACPLIQVRHPDRPTGIHCVNCFQLPTLRDADRRSQSGKADALSRVAHLNTILDGAGPFDAAHMKRVLRNHDGQAVCRHGSETSEHNTEFSMICLPAQNKILYRGGRPCEGEFEEIAL